ncbi:MAG: hypothetical protein U0905_12950 [Pirellulales bacterium]
MNTVGKILLYIAISVQLDAVSESQLSETDEQLGARTSFIAINWRQGFPRFLIEQKDIQSDLGLSTKTIEALTQVFESIDSEVSAERKRTSPDLSGKNAVERSKLFYANEGRLERLRESLLEKQESQIKAILTMEQLERLQQIILQKAELFQIVRDSKIIEELRITTYQTQCIHALAGKKWRFMQMRAKREIGDAPFRAAMQECDDGIWMVLTTEQAELLRLLRGRPFRVTQK